MSDAAAFEQGLVGALALLGEPLEGAGAPQLATDEARALVRALAAPGPSGEPRSEAAARRARTLGAALLPLARTLRARGPG